MPIIALLTRKCGGVEIPTHLRSTLIVVKTTYIKCFTIPIGNFGPAISLIEVELTIRPTNHRVGGVIVITANKTGKENLPGIPFIKDQIPIYIGVANDVRSLGNIDLIIDHSYSHRCDQIRILHKNSGFICHSIQVCILEYHHLISSIPGFASSIINSLGYPDPPGCIYIKVGWICQ